MPALKMCAALLGGVVGCAGLAVAQADQTAGGESKTATRGRLELNAPETVLTVGGRIAMDSTLDWPSGAYTPRRVPLSGQGESGQLVAHLKNSRLWLKTRTPSAWGTVRTLVEGDFFGSTGAETLYNGHDFRLRHAYIEVGGLMLGQNWSLFVPYATADTIMDPAVMSWIRQPQLRWTHRRGTRAYALALESPETTLTDAAGGQVVPADDRLPDVIARVAQDAAWGRVSVAGLVRQLRQDQAVLSGGGITEATTDQAWGWGLCGSAELRIRGGDDLRMAAVYGDGVGRHIAKNAFDAGTVDAQGRIETLTGWGAYAAYRHWWSHSLRSTLAYSRAGVRPGAGDVAGTANREVASYQLNLFWTPFEHALFGVEYGHLEREQRDGRTGRMGRLYVRTLYNF